MGSDGGVWERQYGHAGSEQNLGDSIVGGSTTLSTVANQDALSSKIYNYDVAKNWQTLRSSVITMHWMIKPKFKTP